MARNLRRQLLVFIVVVTAGCGGFGFSGGDDSATPVTPAPVPTDSATTYPAGVGATGVTSHLCSVPHTVTVSTEPGTR